ncbi:MAG TPA: hypothetical protein PKD12_18970 [Nitrospira sp.]|mgnify:CR=1 FL=1|nr:hypothetical protein [Nitrospira sp.]
MRQKHVLTVLAIVAATGTIHSSQSLARAWQGDIVKNLTGVMANAVNVNDDRQNGRVSASQLDRSFIHKVGADSYSGGYPGMAGSDMKPGNTYTPQRTMPGDQSRPAGEYKAGSSSNEGQYGSNPSDNYLRKESSGSSSGLSGGAYGGAVYGGVPSTPSADPMIKDLRR